MSIGVLVSVVRIVKHLFGPRTGDGKKWRSQSCSKYLLLRELLVARLELLKKSVAHLGNCHFLQLGDLRHRPSWVPCRESQLAHGAAQQ